MKLKTTTIVLIAIVIIMLLVFALVLLYNTLFPKGIFVSLNQTAVVTQIQSLNRLETASFTIEKVIEAGTNGNAFQNILFGDKILLIAHGNIIAGFDLSKLQASDVKVDGTNLHISLPPPQILASYLDEQQTKVYDRKMGLLTKGDSSLESTARQAAEASLRKAACDGGILGVASENAKKQLQATFMTAGFSQVLIDIPTGSCN